MFEFFKIIIYEVERAQDGMQNVKKKNIYVLQVYETTSLKGLGRKKAGLRK